MARIDYPDVEKLPADMRKAMADIPNPPRVFLMWAHSLGTVRQVVELGAAQFGSIKLPTRLRELATLAVAWQIAAEYEWVQHVPTSAVAEVTDEQRAALQRDDLTADCFDETDQAVLALVVAVVTDPTVDDKVFNAARAQLGDGQLVELLGLIGYYWMLGRMCTVLQIDLDVPEGTEVLEAGLRMSAAGRRGGS